MSFVPPTREVGWAELLAHPEVAETVVLASSFGIMAFHGGVEASTAEIARAAAEEAGSSLYIVDQPGTLRWHVPSTLVDPALSPALSSFLKHVTDLVAVHGYGRVGPGDPILVGGSNRTLAREAARRLRDRVEGVAVLDELTAMPAGLRGLHPSNPVNRTLGGGVQIELPVGVRRRQTDAVAAALADLALARTT